MKYLSKWKFLLAILSAAFGCFSEFQLEIEAEGKTIIWAAFALAPAFFIFVLLNYSNPASREGIISNGSIIEFGVISLASYSAAGIIVELVSYRIFSEWSRTDLHVCLLLFIIGSSSFSALLLKRWLCRKNAAEKCDRPDL